MSTIPRCLQIELENVIDAHGLANVVDALAEIAADKSRAARQPARNDVRRALKWDRAAALLRNTEASIANEGL